MKVLITGASGYVGARIYQDLKENHDVIGTYHKKPLFPKLSNLDITDAKEVNKTFLKFLPKIVVHVAANSSSADCNRDPRIPYLINKVGTDNIVNAAKRHRTKVIFISSYAAINADTPYGASKFAGELAVQKSKNYVILRPSLIIGQSPNTENDRPHNRLLRNIKQGKPVQYDASWKFQPTYLRHLSECIGAVIENEISNQTIHIAVPELKSRFDIAKDILGFFDIEVMPVDKNSKIPTIEKKLDELVDLRLPFCYYPELLLGVTEEIKDELA